ncbi:hypothetical protein B0H14DRAFT_3522263 [Mycena olivaceomarginata]|nr:hypothetical protein B0H14DRAFT_3522263 [Mycena olivaceomarginata]
MAGLEALLTRLPDTVLEQFWDEAHQEHTGAEDSAVMYIPAVPLTPANARYVEQQKEHFLKGVPLPDFPVAVTGVRLMGLASDEDVEEPLGRKAIVWVYLLLSPDARARQSPHLTSPLF